MINIDILKNYEGLYYVSIKVDDNIFMLDEEVSNLLNLTIDEYMKICSKYGARIFCGSIYFNKKYKCENFIENEIKARLDVIDSKVVLFKLIDSYLEQLNVN